MAYIVDESENPPKVSLIFDDIENQAELQFSVLDVAKFREAYDEFMEKINRNSPEWDITPEDVIGD